MRTFMVLLVALSGASALRHSAVAAPDATAPAKPPEAPVKPVTETLFGRQVTDKYRYMEALDPATLEWMKGQGAYTRAVLDEIQIRSRGSKPTSENSRQASGLIQGFVVSRRSPVL